MNRNADKRLGRYVIQLICVILLLSLLIEILSVEIQRNAVSYGGEAAKRASYTVTDSFSGYIFRDETTLRSSNNGPIEYLVPDGSAVKKGDPLVNVYIDDTGTDKRQSAAAIYEEIARLEQALEKHVIAWQLTYTESYQDMMSAVSAGDLRAGLSAADGLASTLERRSAFGDNEAQLRVRIATLRAQAEELVRYVDAPQAFVSQEDGYYFSRQTDGYEALFGTAAAQNVTPEGLKNLLESKQLDSNAVGKLVSAGEFYLAVPVCEKQAREYTVNSTYRVRMARGGELQMLLSRIARSDDGTELLLIFWAARCPAHMDLCRRQPIEIERQTVSGLRVPASALCHENGEDAVYVTSNGTAAKRRVEILCREGGSCIVAIRHEEGYLREGEVILITARSVYEGKELRR